MPTQELPAELRRDLERNREARLSSRQRIELITAPLSTLLLLSVPLILLAGRYGPAGRVIVLALIAGFVITIGLRAFRFWRVKLCYRLLFAEATGASRFFRRKTTLASQSGDTVKFDERLSRKQKIKPDQSLHVYFVETAGRRILLNMTPRDHDQAHLAEPSERFEQLGGRFYAD